MKALAIVHKQSMRLEYETLAENWLDAARRFVEARTSAGHFSVWERMKECRKGRA